MAAMSSSSTHAAAVQTVTPELRRWIIEQAEAGCRPADVVQAMVTSGWHEDVAIQAMEDTLRQHLAELEAARQLPLVGSAGSAASVQAAGSAPAGGPAALANTALAGAAALPEPVAVPEPALQGAPATLHAGGRDVRVLTTLRLPRVVVFGGLLSDDECEAMMALARPRLSRSETVDNSTGGNEVNAARRMKNPS
jgi:prolyl 4-hydroxylase